MSGLYRFDDKPENFRAWQSSFKNAVAEVQLTATQELDLMTKWLGKESGEQMRCIRAMHVNNACLALREAWRRLRACYGGPEIIEQPLFQRLDRFATKDHTKLRKLGDLLMEIQGAKEDGYLTGLSYPDTSRGIGQIVDKLPYGLQEKWVSPGLWYKEDNNGCFPLLVTSVTLCVSRQGDEMTPALSVKAVGHTHKTRKVTREEL